MSDDLNQTPPAANPQISVPPSSEPAQIMAAATTSPQDDLKELDSLLDDILEPEPVAPVGSSNKELPVMTSSREYSFQPAESTPQPENKDRETIQELETAIDNFVQKNSELKQNQVENVTVGPGQEPAAAQNYQQQPVVVLPLTEEKMKEGQKQPPTSSLRWLVTFTQKLMKLFTGRFRYKDAPYE